MEQGYILSLKLDAKQFQEVLSQCQKQILTLPKEKETKFTANIKNLMQGIDDAIKKVRDYGMAYQSVKQLLGDIGWFGKQFTEPASQFEQFKLRLEALYGSAEKAAEVFGNFQAIAAKTPATLMQVVEAGASLKAFGMDAEATLMSVTDLAAYMGMDVVEAAQAVGRAFSGGAGAADILRERGVLQLIKSFKGIDDLTKLSLPEFRKALIETMQDPAAGISGAADKMAKSYAGAISNLQDSFTNLKAKIGSEFTPALTEAAKVLTVVLTALNTDMGTLTGTVGNQKVTVDLLTKSWQTLTPAFRQAALETLIADAEAKKQILSGGGTIWQMLQRDANDFISRMTKIVQVMAQLGNIGLMGSGAGFKILQGYKLTKADVDVMNQALITLGAWSVKGEASEEALKKLNRQIEILESKRNSINDPTKADTNAPGNSASSNTLETTKAENDALIAELDRYIDESFTRNMAAKDKELALSTHKYSQDLSSLLKSLNDKKITMEEFDALSGALFEKYNQEQADITKKYDDQAKAEADKADAEKQAALVSYYDEVKFKDAGYYTWKQEQLVKDLKAELDAGKISQEQYDIISKQRLDALKADKEMYDTAPIRSLMEEHDKWMSQMADGKNIGIQTWKSIKEGLEEYKKALESALAIDPKNTKLQKALDDTNAGIAKANMEIGKEIPDWSPLDVFGIKPEDRDKVMGTYNAMANQINGIARGMIQLSEQRKQKEFDNLEAVAQKEGWSNERLLSEKKKINAKYEAEERRYRNIQKTMNIAQAIINTAEGMTAAMKWGIPMGPIFAMIIAAMGAVQVGIIRAQKFASGGLFKGIGGDRDDMNLVRISNNEFITNAASTRRFLPQLEAINKGIDPSKVIALGGMNDAKLDELIKSVQILNMNLVKKGMDIQIINNADTEMVVKQTDKSRKAMAKRGYEPDLQR